MALGAAPTNSPAPSGAPPPAPKDTLEFLSGDILRGSFLSLDEKGGVRWQHSSIKQVLTVNPSGIYKVTLPPAKVNRTVRPNCVARLANGDELMGTLVALDEKDLTLETWYAGTLQLPRSGLAALSVGLGRFNVLYEGPTGPEGWNIKGSNVRVGGGAVFVNGVLQAQPAAPPRTPVGWQYKDEAFYGFGTGSLGRDVKLPRVSNIEFDLAWRGYPQLTLFFYTDNLEGYGGNTYALQFSYRNLYLRRQSQSGRSSNLGTIELPVLGRNKARFALRTDRDNKTIALFVDDTLIKQWTDNGDFNEAGTGIQFYLQGGQQAVKLSNIRITEWDGRLDDLPAVVSSPAEDLVRLVNKDKVSGSLKSIRDGKLQMATPFANLEVPLDRVNAVEFAAANIKTNAPAPGEVRVFFADRGRLTLRVARWDEQQMAGSSPNFGQARFLPSAFSAIQFNLDKQKTDTDTFDAALNVPVIPEVFIEN